MPPWAYSVLDSYRSSLVRTRTRPPRASSIAARIPAIPPPRTTKSTPLSLCVTMNDSIIAMSGRLRNSYHLMARILQRRGWCEALEWGAPPVPTCRDRLRKTVTLWADGAKLWSAAACCRFSTSQLAGGESCRRLKFREQVRGEESGNKLPHSKASQLCLVVSAVAGLGAPWYL